MREIKFRAWHKGNESFRQKATMLYDRTPGDCLRWLNEGQNIAQVMQYTGLKDKNGKEIYEGDILNHITYVHSDVGRTGVVCFDQVQCIYKLVPIDCYEINAGNGTFTGFAFDRRIAWESEVIGNIYENPELIKP